MPLKERPLSYPHKPLGKSKELPILHLSPQVLNFHSSKINQLLRLNPVLSNSLFPTVLSQQHPLGFFNLMFLSLLLAIYMVFIFTSWHLILLWSSLRPPSILPFEKWLYFLSLFPKESLSLRFKNLAKICQCQSFHHQHFLREDVSLCFRGFSLPYAEGSHHFFWSGWQMTNASPCSNPVW